MVEVTGRNPVGGDLVRVPAGDPLLPWNDFDPDALTSGSFHSRYVISLGAPDQGDKQLLHRDRPSQHVIGVGKASRPPLPPNRTGGFPAYGSPLGSFSSRLSRGQPGRVECEQPGFREVGI